jgi:hypothetical protein
MHRQKCGRSQRRIRAPVMSSGDRPVRRRKGKSSRQAGIGDDRGFGQGALPGPLGAIRQTGPHDCSGRR